MILFSDVVLLFDSLLDTRFVHVHKYLVLPIEMLAVVNGSICMAESSENCYLKSKFKC